MHHWLRSWSLSGLPRSKSPLGGLLLAPPCRARRTTLRSCIQVLRIAGSDPIRVGTSEEEGDVVQSSWEPKVCKHAANNGEHVMRLRIKASTFRLLIWLVGVCLLCACAQGKATQTLSPARHLWYRLLFTHPVHSEFPDHSHAGTTRSAQVGNSPAVECGIRP